MILSVLFVLTLSTLRHFPMSGMMHPAPSIRVTGRQWWFDGEYLDTDHSRRFHVPTELHIPVGTPVNIELTTRDVIHSFWVPKLHGKVDLVPGQVNHIRVQADRPGVYEGECGEYCGAQHAHMRLRIIADAPADYVRWRAHQLADAAAPDSAATERGQQVFLGAPCVLCHTIRGTPCMGGVPIFTITLAAMSGVMPAAAEQTSSVGIVHAQSFKPGAQMPDIDQLDGEQLRDLTVYLQAEVTIGGLPCIASHPPPRLPSSPCSPAAEAR